MNATAIKDIRNLFRLKKEIKGIIQYYIELYYYIVLRNIKNLFKHEKEENYYKPVSIHNFWSNNYIEYKNNGDKNRILLVEEYLDKIKAHLKSIKIDLKKSDTWKTQLTITIHFFSAKDNNDEERVMHSKTR